MPVRSVRFETRVIHRHRIGQKTIMRVSELTYVDAVPHAILHWIDNGGVNVPITVPLEYEALRPAAGRPTIFFYKGVTVDPRYADLPQ